MSISGIIFIMVIYRNSWLPGGIALQGKEIFVIVILIILAFVYQFDLNILNNFLNFNLLRFENVFFLFIFFSYSISIFVYNRQEISTVFNVFYTSTFLGYTYLFFIKVPQILCKSKELMKSFFVFIFYLGSFITFFGLLIYFAGISPIEKYEFAAYSIIVHPNFTANLYTSFIICSVFYYLYYRIEFSDFYKRIVLVSIILQIISQLFTFGRGGYVGTAVSLGILFAFFYRKKIILLFPVIISLSALIFPRFLSAKGTGSFLSRFMLLIPAYHMMNENRTVFLWGYGAFSNIEIFSKYMIIYNILEENISDPHNSYIRLILMFGIIFTASLIIYILYLLSRLFFRILKSTSENERLFNSFLLAATAGLLVQNLFDSGLSSTVFFHIQFFLLYLGIIRIILNSKV
ncbi:MAG TPA: hypothetical protein PKE39_03360 [Ignavibacteria bacterium]|nr:hypothetical protein [Ignavibacteria bacterium]